MILIWRGRTRRKYMKRQILGVVTGAMLLWSAPSLAGSETVSVDELSQCREIADSEQRLACYDGIGKPAPAIEPTATVAEPLAQDTAAAAEVVPAAKVDSAYRELTDDVGLPKTDATSQQIRATVVRCGQANNRKFYFYFDNGQVWEYIGGKRLRYKNCDTQASLIEDGLGFKMQLDGESLEMRVRRVK
jgi:hypothetical protein